VQLLIEQELNCCWDGRAMLRMACTSYRWIMLTYIQSRTVLKLS